MGLIAGLQRVREQLEGPLHVMPMLVGPSRKGFLGRLTGAALPVLVGCHVCHQSINVVCLNARHSTED